MTCQTDLHLSNLSKLKVFIFHKFHFLLTLGSTTKYAHIQIY